ncbi:hypothetical protein LTR09_003517 [Extremus antarcticus]|uniref:Uncharacterized protein n=1 Tax=Extremus antarcticus TaxID=702011 RepID=A0AAJ0GDA4_9PEZI|nr:hypothetical protein LTR09_003517 [Extremus antarcticus]
MDLSLWRVWVRKLLTSFVAEGKKVLQRRSESYRHRSWVPSLLASAESPSPPGTSDIAFPHIHLQHHTEPPNIQPPLLKQSKQRSDQARDSSKMFRHALRQFGFEQLRGGQRGFFTNNVGAVWEAWKRYHEKRREAAAAARARDFGRSSPRDDLLATLLCTPRVFMAKSSKEGHLHNGQARGVSAASDRGNGLMGLSRQGMTTDSHSSMVEGGLSASVDYSMRPGPDG